MAKYEHLPRAPIQEAVIDIRFEVPESTDLIRDESIHQLFVERFPEVRFQRQISGEFKIREEELVHTSADAAVVAATFRSPERPQVLQLRHDRLVFSWLKPYEDWNALKTEALDAWQILQARIGVKTVTRIGVRYVNRFAIPIPADLEEYLVHPMEFPADVGGQITDFVWRTTILNELSTTFCRYTVASKGTSDGDSGDIIIDVDCFRNGVLPPMGDPLEDRLAELRDLKNRIFFEGLTDRALEMFR